MIPAGRHGAGDEIRRSPVKQRLNEISAPARRYGTDVQQLHAGLQARVRGAISTVWARQPRWNSSAPEDRRAVSRGVILAGLGQGLEDPRLQALSAPPATWQATPLFRYRYRQPSDPPEARTAIFTHNQGGGVKLRWAYAGPQRWVRDRRDQLREARRTASHRPVARRALREQRLEERR